MQEYLRPTYTIDCDAEPVRAKAEDLTRGLETPKEKAVALFYFVRDQIRFNPFSPAEQLEYNKASAVLARGNGFCYQKAILLAALSRASAIPARLRFADIRNHILSEEFAARMFGSNLLVYHGYAELHLDGRWVAATPAYDLKMCQDNGFIPVDFDGERDAKLHRNAADGRLHIEYVKEHGHRQDFPWEEILRARDEFVAALGIDVGQFMAKWRSVK